MTDADRYDPREYWGELHRREDLGATGHYSLPVSFNRWLYRNGQRNLDRLLQRMNLDVPPTVFDAGVGSGFWVQHWLDRGATRVDGCDLIAEAVARVAKTYPGIFTVFDLADGRPTESVYPLVSAMNVLLHITSDEAFDRALNGLAAMVEPNGYLLLAEPAVFSRTSATAFSPHTHARIRHVSAYKPAGLDLVAVVPTTVIGADPIEGSKLWRFAWGIVSRSARKWPSLGGVAGRGIYLLDPMLLRLGLGPSGKFLLFRRPTR